MYRIVLVVSVDKERERDLSIRELCHQHTETCYNAANQFGLKPEPHIFIDAQVISPRRELKARRIAISIRP